MSSVSCHKLRSIVVHVIQLGESSPVWLAGKMCFVYVDVSKPHVAVRAEHLASSGRATPCESSSLLRLDSIVGADSAAHSSPDIVVGLCSVA